MDHSSTEGKNNGANKLPGASIIELYRVILSGK
jgi:hypothetical protein